MADGFKAAVSQTAKDLGEALVTPVVEEARQDIKLIEQGVTGSAPLDPQKLAQIKAEEEKKKRYWQQFLQQYQSNYTKFQEQKKQEETDKKQQEMAQNQEKKQEEIVVEQKKQEDLATFRAQRKKELQKLGG